MTAGKHAGSMRETKEQLSSLPHVQISLRISCTPIKEGSSDKLDLEALAGHFGSLSSDRLKVTPDAVFFRVDIAYQSKIGIRPRGSLASSEVMTRRLLNAAELKRLHGGDLLQR